MDTYHPARTSTYVLKEEVDDGDDCDGEWMIGSYSISRVLEGSRDMSMKIPPSNMPDLRLLAINNIYLFILACDESVLKYFDVYSEGDEYGKNDELLCDEIQDVLRNDDGNIELTTNILIWADKLSNASTTVTDWVKIQRITIGYLNASLENNNKYELIAANILHKLTLDFCNRSPDMNLEDSFAHNIVSSIFEAVFESDALLSFQWTNGYLQGSDKYIIDEEYDVEVVIIEVSVPNRKVDTNHFFEDKKKYLI
ncbi:unnamed protein product [Mucor fragilis]